MSNESNEGITDRGFSGPTKFSEFRRGATTNAPPSVDPATNTKGATKANKDSNVGIKARSLGEDEWSQKTHGNEYYDFEEAEPVEKKNTDGIVGYVSYHLSEITKEVKDEVKDLYERVTHKTEH